MAQTAAQKKAAQEALKKAKALLANQKAALTKLEDQAALANPAPARVNTTTLEGIQKASAVPAPATSTDTYYTSKVGTTGLTQAQIDTRAEAESTANQINEAYGSMGIKSSYDPVTGKVTTEQNGNVLTNTAYTPPKDNPMDNPVYAALLAAMGVYNISGLAETLLAIRTAYPDITSEDMLSLLRYDKRYNAGYLQRFAGNAKLSAAGKPMLTEKEYLANEMAYEKIFKAYDVARFANTSQYADLIGNSLAPDEVNTRVSMAYNRIINADANVLTALKKFGSSLSTGDLVAAMLDPRNQVPELNKKITSAEIGGAALRQGLQAFEAATSIQSSRYTNVTEGTIGTEAARLSGADAESARVAYEKIAEEVPRGEFLSSISKGVPQYAQAQAEEANILGLASAKRKKQDLIALEAARFSASAGNIGSKSFKSPSLGII
jgi:hypothetical protein